MDQPRPPKSASTRGGRSTPSKRGGSSPSTREDSNTTTNPSRSISPAAALKKDSSPIVDPLVSLEGIAPTVRMRGVVVGLPKYTRNFNRGTNTYPDIPLKALLGTGRIVLEDSKLAEVLTAAAYPHSNTQPNGSQPSGSKGGAFGKKDGGSSKFGGEWRAEGNIVKTFRTCLDGLITDETIVCLRGPHTDEELDVLAREAVKHKVFMVRDAGKGAAFSKTTTKSLEWHRDYMKRNVRFRVNKEEPLCLGVIEEILADQNKVSVRVGDKTHAVDPSQLLLVPLGTPLTRAQQEIVPKSFNVDTLDGRANSAKKIKLLRDWAFGGDSSSLPLIQNEAEDLATLAKQHAGAGVEFSMVQVQQGRRLRICFDETDADLDIIGHLVYTCLPHWSPAEAPYVVYAERRAGKWDPETQTWTQAFASPSLNKTPSNYSLAFQFDFEDLQSETEGAAAYFPAIGDVVSFSPRVSLATGVLRATCGKFESADPRRMVGVVESVATPSTPFGVIRSSKGRSTKYHSTETIYSETKQPSGGKLGVMSVGDVCDYALGAYDVETKARLGINVRVLPKSAALKLSLTPTSTEDTAAQSLTTPAKITPIVRPASTPATTSAVGASSGFAPTFVCVEPRPLDQETIRPFSAAAWRNERVGRVDVEESPVDPAATT